MPTWTTASTSTTTSTDTRTNSTTADPCSAVAVLRSCDTTKGRREDRLQLVVSHKPQRCYQSSGHDRDQHPTGNVAAIVPQAAHPTLYAALHVIHVSSL